ncbi:S-layer homology domain-containing protein [Bacillota bacterium LX-D]|nr:S-layer homology domain-containing protein [Bacillota bacterium LX-D]
MKKGYMLMVVLLFIFLAQPMAWAAQQFSGHLTEGIANEYDYEEVTFITGEPILLTGTAKISESGRTDKVSTRITYSLKDSTGTVKLSRSVSFTTTLEKKLEEQQTVSVTDADRVSETITVGKDRYTLEDCQYNRSALTDNKPGVDYFSGNWNAKKTYNLNKDQAKVVVESWGDTVGYNHAWGSTETQKIDNTITFSGKKVIDKEEYDQEWSGTYQCNLSFNRTKELTYKPNEPTQISFAGGYLQTEQEEQTLEISYDLPVFNSNGLLKNSKRETGDDSYKLLTTPTQKRLPIPLLRDVQGHWAEEDILKLASLEALPIKGNYFGPALNMTRGEFTWAIAKLADIVPETTTTARSTARKTVQEVSPFADVPADHPYYKYIKAACDKGIVSGTGTNRFNPDEPLTRAQAVNMLIRTMGFEGLAPLYNSTTSYRDDAKIPYWARDAIYVGSEIGLISGKNGYCLPNQTMSRAEAAVFLNRFIQYLQKDMKYEYRERLLNFR